MIPTKWYMAEVTNNDDSTLDDQAKLGRVQVRILPEMADTNGCQITMLPWARPFNMPTDSHFAPPAIGTRVFVVAFDDFFKVLFYKEHIFQDHLLKYADQMTALANVPTLQTASAQYPVLHFTKHEDGTITFHNKKTGEMGVLHKSGAYTLFDKDGNIIQNAKGQKFTYKNDLADLKDIVEKIRGVVQDIITPGNLIGNLGAPVLFQVPADVPLIKTTVKTNITDLFK